MAQSGHVNHYPVFQYGGRKTGNCKIFHKIKLRAVVSPLPDKISTKFQQLYHHFRDPAIHSDLWKYGATKPEVDKCKMASTKLHMHVSPLSDKLSTKFQRLYSRFRGPAFHCYAIWIFPLPIWSRSVFQVINIPPNRVRSPSNVTVITRNSPRMLRVSIIEIYAYFTDFA